MSKRRRKSRRQGDRFVMLYHWLLECPAWRALKPGERALYVAFKYKYNGSNNGKIGFGVREAARFLNVSKDTAGKYFKGLQQKGFIKVMTGSSFDTRKNRLATEWILTEMRLAGISPSKEFMRWRSPKNDYPIYDGASSLQRFRRQKLND